jgi:hypothetical protein
MKSCCRERANGNLYAINWFLRRFYLRFVKKYLPGFRARVQSDLERAITVVIPAVEKDADVLEQCLCSVQQFIQNTIAAIWVVAPESTRIRALASKVNAIFVPEDQLLPLPAAALKTRGWVLQQLIKLNACHHVETTDYLVLDADTIFLRPQNFFCNGLSVLRYSDQYELLYNRSLEMIFGNPRRFPVSFVTHHMLFNVTEMKGLLHLIEQRFGRPWWQAILHEVDKGHPVSFSEYELYGHFVLSQPCWVRRYILEYWHGLDQNTKDLVDLEKVRKQAAGTLNTVSFHWHTQ